MFEKKRVCIRESEASLAMHKDKQRKTEEKAGPEGMLAGDVEAHCLPPTSQVLQHVAVCCSVVQCTAACCSVMLCRRSVCCRRDRSLSLPSFAVCCSVLQCVAVCCDVLQCVAMCCSVLQCVAMCCSVL